MKKLLVLGGSEFQIPLLKQAKTMGIHTYVLDINPNAPAIKYADVYQTCSLKDDQLALQLAREYQPDGVTVGMCDVAVCTCAKICEALGLPGLSLPVAQRATDKFQMIEAFHQAHVPSPEYIYFPKNSFSKDRITIPYPFICKPTDMAGSRGINLIHCEAELEAAIRDSVASGDSGDILIEEYMVGPEVSVEMFVEEDRPSVLQITDKLTSGAPHFMELGHSQPSGLPQAVKDAIADVACAAARALGLYNCPAHAEIIITDKGPKMVEIGARMGGDGIQQQLIELSTGINLQEAVIRMAMGEQVKTPKATMQQGSAIRFIPAREGIVRAIKETVITDRRVREIKIFCKEGTVIDSVKDNSARFGYVVAQADSAADAVIACEKAMEGICIDVEKA